MLNMLKYFLLGFKKEELKLQSETTDPREVTNRCHVTLPLLCSLEWEEYFCWMEGVCSGEEVHPREAQPEALSHTGKIPF